MSAKWRPKPAEVQAGRIARADTGRRSGAPKPAGGHDGLHNFALYRACHCVCPGCWQWYETGGRCICRQCPCYVLP